MAEKDATVSVGGVVLETACDGQSHPVLQAVEGIYAFYRCLGCGHYFNLQLLNVVRHTPTDLARVVHWAALDLLQNAACPTQESNAARAAVESLAYRGVISGLFSDSHSKGA